MTKEEIERMKAVPGLYLVKMDHPVFVGALLVASIGGKLYGMVADNELCDEGWNAQARLDRCLFKGGLSRIEA
jgi:hypothetical protein